jgi:hypothetical protein
LTSISRKRKDIVTPVRDRLLLAIRRKLGGLKKINFSPVIMRKNRRRYWPWMACLLQLRCTALQIDSFLRESRPFTEPMNGGAF